MDCKSFPLPGRRSLSTRPDGPRTWPPANQPGSLAARALPRADNGMLVFSLYSKMLVVSRSLLPCEFLAGLLLAFAPGWLSVGAADHQVSKLPPQQLVQEAVENELAANRTAPMHFLFKD